MELCETVFFFLREEPVLVGGLDVRYPDNQRYSGDRNASSFHANRKGTGIYTTGTLQYRGIYIYWENLLQYVSCCQHFLLGGIFLNSRLLRHLLLGLWCMQGRSPSHYFHAIFFLLFITFFVLLFPLFKYFFHQLASANIPDSFKICSNIKP